MARAALAFELYTIAPPSALLSSPTRANAGTTLAALSSPSPKVEAPFDSQQDKEQAKRLNTAIVIIIFIRITDESK